MSVKTSRSILVAGIFAFLGMRSVAGAQYPDWQHSGTLYILTTPEGANLPASAREKDFPVVVRLEEDFFDFSKAEPGGEDMRFATAAGAPLAYQIEQWDTAGGTASIWVRIPEIHGNARQAIRMFWGNAVGYDRDDWKLQVGYWGMELAKELAERHRGPIVTE